MTIFAKTMKLHIHPDNEAISAFKDTMKAYREACNNISGHIFNNGFDMDFASLQRQLYADVRSSFGLKSQMALSTFKTVIARYKTVEEQLWQSPYKYKDADGKWHYIQRDLEWMWYPIKFRKPQVDLVRNRDYSFVKNGTALSINTLNKRVMVSFDVPDCFEEYFNSEEWSFGTAKLVCSKGKWYLHISVTKEISDNNAVSGSAKHVVGIDRGLRFLITTYDENGHTTFVSGKNIISRRESFKRVRAELQSKGTKSAKRVLKRMSERENRWMSDVNHQVSKTLADTYGPNTLFVMEDLTNVSFDDRNLNSRSKKDRNELRSWAFYQLEQCLKYKASENGAMLIKVSPKYTSQRCPKCGRIHKENRNHDTHEYVCDSCGYRSNDDRVGAMNLYTLGTLYLAGDDNPHFKDSDSN